MDNFSDKYWDTNIAVFLQNLEKFKLKYIIDEEYNQSLWNNLERASLIES